MMSFLCTLSALYSYHESASMSQARAETIGRKHFHFHAAR
jgi:hypothetical protein